MSSSAFLLAASMLLPMAGRAANAQEALAEARKQVEAADYRMSGRLVHVDGSGARTSYGVHIKALWSPGILRVLFEVTSPAKARARVLLEMRPEEKSTIQIAHPGDAVATVLPFDKWNEGPLGEEFSYEDFLDSWYFWAGQTDMGQVKFGVRNCDLLRSTPGTADRTHYAEVKSWLDRQSDFPVYVEKTVKGSGIVKQFIYYGLRQTEGVWSASQVESKIRGHTGSILLIIDHGTPRAHLGMKDFSSAQLTGF
jgi:Outer membrane lipoprotein-sorting protein